MILLATYQHRHMKVYVNARLVISPDLYRTDLGYRSETLLCECDTIGKRRNRCRAEGPKWPSTSWCHAIDPPRETRALDSDRRLLSLKPQRL